MPKKVYDTCLQYKDDEYVPIDELLENIRIRALIFLRRQDWVSGEELGLALLGTYDYRQRNNMSVHLRRMAAKGHVAINKMRVGQEYRITPKGKAWLLDKLSNKYVAMAETMF